jgi:septin family protein
MRNLKDNRVHLLLYFFGGHHTNASDFTIIKKLQKHVNVIPIIPKADSFTSDELLRMKIDIINSGIDRNVNFFDCFDAI